jgi:hypothetical protein
LGLRSGAPRQLSTVTRSALTSYPRIGGVAFEIALGRDEDRLLQAATDRGKEVTQHVQLALREELAGVDVEVESRRRSKPEDREHVLG